MTNSGAIEGETLRLWTGDPPVGDAAATAPKVTVRHDSEDRLNRFVTGVVNPELTIVRPSAERATGAAVVIFPGGGYSGQAIDKEGHFVARWLADRGVVGVVTPYRCGGGKHIHPTPMHDAQRAVQTVRRHAERWGVDPERVGVMGFSAGGHLAATAATQWVAPDPQAEDPVAREGSRPDFAVLVYPVISLREGVGHQGSRINLLGAEADESLVAAMSADERVTSATPPILLIHSADDRAVPFENSVRFYKACVANGAPAEMHLYETGGHGYGMWADEGTVATWPHALEAWLVNRGLAQAAAP